MTNSSDFLLVFLKKNNFVFEGTWNRDKEKIYFSSLREKAKNQCVYIWLAKKENRLLPIYIGKAKNGVIERMNQHKGGFRDGESGSNSGRRLRKVIEKLLNLSFTIEVHSRNSLTNNEISVAPFDFNYNNIDLLQIPNISLFSYEEELLIRFFELNFPEIRLMNGIKENNLSKLYDMIKALG
jgi:hypothetical protein